ncbi:hypothetical protein OG21DRAFT_517978 [Imleria badia]|nr:hypothetical protein OG21DRAFT_517978 [Imleria badia]
MNYAHWAAPRRAIDDLQQSFLPSGMRQSLALVYSMTFGLSIACACILPSIPLLNLALGLIIDSKYRDRDVLFTIMCCNSSSGRANGQQGTETRGTSSIPPSQMQAASFAFPAPHTAV